MRALFVLLLMPVLAAQAQSKLTYSAELGTGFLKGKSGKSQVYLFSNGIAYKNVMAGIGVGIDNYQLRSVPLFLDIRKDFGNRLLRPFVDGSVGINISAVNDEQKGSYNWYADAHFKNGFFAKASFGASLKLCRNLRLYAEAGDIYKTTRISYTNPFNYFPPGTTVVKSVDVYRFSRLFAAAGIQFSFAGKKA